MKTRNNLERKNNAKKTRKNKFLIEERLLKSRALKGGALTEEQTAYYKDFMTIKSDATTILHQNSEIRVICVEMCKWLTYKICMTENDIFKYVKYIYVPDTFKNENGIDIDMEKVKEFIKNEFINNEEQFQLSLEAFTKIHSGSQVPTTDDIKNYSIIFYRFYLKGGSAFVFMIQLYNFYISSHEELKKINRTISEEEIVELLGKSSDYDFNFLINRNMQKNHYEILTLHASVTITNYLIEIVYKYGNKLFNNKSIIDKFRRELLTNAMPLYTEDKAPPQIFKVKGKFNEYVSQFGYDESNRLLTSIRNNPMKNKLGHVNINALEFHKQAYKGEGLKNENFILIRLMTLLLNSLNRTEAETNVDQNANKFSQICAELIDVSIPIYNGVEKNVKWLEESNTIIMIDGVYCYNLNVIIKDLKRMIFEDEAQGNLKKIEKRKKRLLFFNNLICILPRLLFENNELYKHTGLQDTYDNCKKVISFVFSSEDFDERPKLLNDLKIIMEGIYLTFPETINNENLNIYVLLKQYFYYYLIISVQNQSISHINYFSKNNSFKLFEDNTNAECAYVYNSTNEKYFNFLVKFPQSEMYVCLDNMNVYMYNIVCKCIDELKMKNTSVVNLSKYLILFNSFIYSFTNNSMLQFEALINFIKFLMFLNETEYAVPYQHLINLRQNIKNSITEQEKLLSNIMDGSEMKKNIIIHTLSFINSEEHMGKMKLYMYGNYAYQLYYMLTHFRSNIHQPTSEEMDIFLKQNYSIFDDFKLKIILPNSMIDDGSLELNVNKIYDYYKKMIVYIFNKKFNLMISSYPCKIYINLSKDYKNSYNITGKIDLLHMVNDDVINSEYLFMTKIINETLLENEKYRVLSYTFLNINIEIESETDLSDKTYYTSLKEIIDDNDYLNEEYKIDFFNNYQELLEGENIYDNLLIEPIETIIDNYNKIINDKELDILIKYKYIKTLLNLGIKKI